MDRRRGQRSTPNGAYRPVMLDEVLAALNPQPGEVAVDCTLGFAGHALELLRLVGPTGTLIALDGCQLALGTRETCGHLGKLPPPSFQFRWLPDCPGKCRFRGMRLSARRSGHVEHAGRRSRPRLLIHARRAARHAHGYFAWPNRGRVAQSSDGRDLASAFRELGDEAEADKIAAAIVNRRETKPLERTRELDLVMEAAPCASIRIR